MRSVIFFCTDPETPELYTLSLHDALPISPEVECIAKGKARTRYEFGVKLSLAVTNARARSEEHTSELQSRRDLVCRLLLEKKNWFAAFCVQTLNSSFLAAYTSWHYSISLA